MAGYGGKPLAQKLGLKPGQRVLWVHAPAGYDRKLARAAGIASANPARGPLDVIQVFVKRRKDLEARLPGLKERLQPAGMLWVSWPKKASGVPSDLTEDVVREVALAHALVDVKVCAVDEVWSALKLVRRRKDR
jgi:hypothetical protein